VAKPARRGRGGSYARIALARTARTRRDAFDYAVEENNSRSRAKPVEQGRRHAPGRAPARASSAAACSPRCDGALRAADRHGASFSSAIAPDEAVLGKDIAMPCAALALMPGGIEFPREGISPRVPRSSVHSCPPTVSTNGCRSPQRSAVASCCSIHGADRMTARPAGRRSWALLSRRHDIGEAAPRARGDLKSCAVLARTERSAFAAEQLCHGANNPQHLLAPGSRWVEYLAEQGIGQKNL